MDRTDLLITMADGRAALRLTLAGLTEPQMEDVVNGAWTRRDVLAHLEAWERRTASLLETLRRGWDPGGSDDSSSWDVMNERFFEENRHRSLDDVRRGEADAYEALVRMVEESPDDDLFDPDRFAWTNGRPFAGWILGNTSEHYAEHMDQLEPDATRVRRPV
jgi:hypothetical protein